MDPCGSLLPMTNFLSSLGGSYNTKKPSEQELPPREIAIKIVVLGESGSGKTSLSRRFCRNEFSLSPDSTVGLAYFETSLMYQEGSEKVAATEAADEGATKTPTPAENTTSTTTNTTATTTTTSSKSQRRTKVTFRIWDTAGQEKYHALSSMYYRGAAAAILVFDLSQAYTFETMQSWVEELKDKGPPDIVLVVCGNKADLERLFGERQVSRERAEEFANRMGAAYVETSARDNSNVQQVFEYIAQKIVGDSEKMELIEQKASEEADDATVDLGATASPRDPAACCGP